jgi:hypothetical protein
MRRTQPRQARPLLKQAEAIRSVIEQFTKTFHAKMLKLVEQGEVTALFGDEITADDFFDFVIDNTSALDDASHTESSSSDTEASSETQPDETPKRRRC